MYGYLVETYWAFIFKCIPGRSYVFLYAVTFRTARYQGTEIPDAYKADITKFSVHQIVRVWNVVNVGYHADTPITIKAEASSKADSHPN